MFHRALTPPQTKSFFLLGPRGTGKSSWVRARFPEAPYIDLLDSEIYAEMLANPKRLEAYVAKQTKRIVIDEIQRVPELLNEVHRLIEGKRLAFVLTGSSARKLRRSGVNLLAGRALSLTMHPLTASELGEAFQLKHSLQFGQLPLAYTEPDPRGFLKSYVSTYLREEVQQEGLTRNLPAFARFLETLSFSQGSVMNLSAIARDAAVNRKMVEDYVGILEDLMLGLRLPAFTKRAKRRVVQAPKFYFFDCGVFQAIRPRGPLDATTELGGLALETLVMQELRAAIDYAQRDATLHYWRTASGHEVDFVLYGADGLRAIEVKHTDTLRGADFHGLKSFREEYQMAACTVLYLGRKASTIDDIEIRPVADFLRQLPTWI